MQHPYTYYVLFKKADLLHKWGFVDSQMLGTVMYEHLFRNDCPLVYARLKDLLNLTKVLNTSCKMKSF